MASIGSSNKTLEKAKQLMTMAASVATTAMVARSVINDFLPQQAQDFIYSSFHSFFNRRRDPDNMTIVVEKQKEHRHNELYDDAELYLDKMVLSSTNKSLKVWKEGDETLTVKMDRGGEVVDVFEGVELRWSFDARVRKNDESSEDPNYVLTFNQNHRDMVIERYLPHVMEKANAIRASDTDISLHIQNDGGSWESMVLEHPATFDTVALNPDLKQMLISDIDRFVKRKDHYRRIGKPWKRGYLLYGPPGTGKSSLVAAIANYLKFDIYDLDLTKVRDNKQLKWLLLQTSNQSVIVVEDIDCSIDIWNRETEEKAPMPSDSRVTLSGLLNAFDGLLSSCGDERIFVFTTNHKGKLDPALLRPGRMDLHLHLSYCTPPMFRVLMKNYHSIDDHFMFSQIERLMVEVEVTPAEVAGELLRSEDVEVVLRYIETLLLEKSKEKEEENVD